MNQIAITPEVQEHFHELAKATQRSDAEVIDEALTSYLAADRQYLKVLLERLAAADRGEFASREETARFFANTANDASRLVEGCAGQSAPDPRD